jgi:hypothetical protein
MIVGTRDLTRHPKLAEKGIERIILSTPIWLNNKDLLIKKSFNEGLKFKKICENMRLMTQQVGPSKLTIIINKWDNIFLHPKFSIAGPHTSEKMCSRGAGDRLEETGYGNWWALTHAQASQTDWMELSNVAQGKLFLLMTWWIISQEGWHRQLCHQSTEILMALIGHNLAESWCWWRERI